MRYCLWMLTAAVLLSGCQGPYSTGGYPQGVPYRGYGVDGPGPGVIPPGPAPIAAGPMGAMPMGAVPPGYQPMSLAGHVAPDGSGQIVPSGAPGMPAMPVAPCPGPACPMPQGAAPSSQIYFPGEEGLTIYWDETVPGALDSEPLTCPGTRDFPQGGVYRLKLVNIPGHPSAELYPTLEVAPTMARTQAYLAHCPVPVEFTAADFDQAFSGNFVTKVVYLPNPEYQGLAMAGVGTLVNTQLEPGVDPIVEAGNRGAILAVVRLGNKDLGASSRQASSRNTQGQMRLAPMGGPNMPGPAMMGGAPGPMFMGGMPGPMNGQMPGTYAVNGTSIPQNAISGVNIPPYGIPMTKTSTGIPGPPQLPQGRHATNRYPVLRAEPIPAPPVPGATLVQPQPMVGMPYPMDVFSAPQPQR